MIAYDQNKLRSFDSIPTDAFWNLGDENEQKMHRIHSYPAKFPAFITTKAIEYARSAGHSPKQIADIFCGCGTVAYEAMRNNIDFWGCDINPVATLIAKVKSKKYQTKRLNKYLKSIIWSYQRSKTNDSYRTANERLQYWYSIKQYNQLKKLKASVDRMTPDSSEYRAFFICAFSNILKPTSRWLTKSIKPQVDPDKIPVDPFAAFCQQCEFMITANQESDINGNLATNIVTNNILNTKLDKPLVDMIVTSPPYVTSYEYADLHQLTSLWLNYANDYRDLREGTIGSIYQEYNFKQELKRLNSIGSKIVFRLMDQHHKKVSSVAKYFLDMQRTAIICHRMLRRNGLAFFVIGNTEYKNVRIENAQHLAESLRNAGFSEVNITKRKIINKFLTPYRDNCGRFTTDSTGRKIYNEEFILVGSK